MTDHDKISWWRLRSSLLGVVVDNQGPWRLTTALDNLHRELVLGVGPEIVQHGVEVGGVAVVVLGSLRLEGGGAGVPDDVVPGVGDQLVPGQGGVHPGEDDRVARQHDGVEAHGRNQRSPRCDDLLVPRPRRLVDGASVANVVVGSQ